MKSVSTLETLQSSGAGADDNGEAQRASTWRRFLARRHGGALLLVALTLAIGLATRVTLLFLSFGDVNWNLSLPAAIGWGMIFDAGAAWLMAAPFAFFLAVLPRRVFRFATVRGLFRLAVCTAIFGLLFLALADVLFWLEFGAQFNFIAVDYLVYTTEVIGNIRESYPLPWLVGAIGGGAVGLTWLLARAGLFREWFAHCDEASGVRWSATFVWLAAAGLIVAVLDESRLPTFANNYHRELAKNAVWSFFAAFRANQLEFEKFYPTIPTDMAFTRVHRLLADGATPIGNDRRDLLRLVTHDGPERRLNVIQITVESLSASFLGHFGNHENLTPTLDALIPQALVFDQFYATGTRTVRGMEAMTLSVPPTPGRSLVKRPHNEQLFTLGSVLRSRGYDTVFLYGGFGYFDNMNHFFGENGYRIVDRAAVSKSDVTFANAWGACDEDLYRWTLREADAAYAKGKPFFHFVMTTSNHRPYTYPDEDVALPSKVSGRRGAVSYTDHAIGELLAAASTKPWYRDTIFAIVADHCASSAGRAELPLQNYHIPLIIYTPGGQVKPGVVGSVASQIDYAPTLLGLLRWTYPSRFFGRDVLVARGGSEQGRALIGNYQRLGLYVGEALGNLAVLAPVREMKTLHYDAATHATVPVKRNAALLADAIAYYETASFVFKHGKQAEYVAAAP